MVDFSLSVLPEVVELVARAERVVVFTGAGVSAESGIDTFRDPQGLWARFKPEELASIEGFLGNPERVWQWYQYRRAIVASAQPNAGHVALARLESVVPQFTLITQNVDRLHQRAGSQNVLELHGNIVDNHCFQCGENAIVGTEEAGVPCCRMCGGMVRPSVVWFGENLPAKTLLEAEDAAANCDVMIVAGTSGEVFPAAALPWTARRSGASVVELNPNHTALSLMASKRLPFAFAQTMPELVRLLEQRRT